MKPHVVIVEIPGRDEKLKKRREENFPGRRCGVCRTGFFKCLLLTIYEY